MTFSSNGHLLRQVAVASSSNLLLDLAVHPTTGALLVIDFGKQTVFSLSLGRSERLRRHPRGRRRWTERPHV
ncbi:MAG: hypothetical protein E6I60_14965 [Chloroflexi bacterium]|nr:MAG: hypothetical protein E6I60_14965 [Chloroflexota bacterium]